MAQCVVIADDLTGANATGVLLKKMGYAACTAIGGGGNSAALPDCDCLLYATDSRGVDPDTAYRRVYDACSMLKGPAARLYSKRIDSTLRGNLGPEIDAMLDCLGEEYVAVAAPCFPESGRIVAGGYMLVNGVPLHKTDIANDPKSPVHVSEVAELLRTQSRYRTRSFLIRDMMGGAACLADEIRKSAGEGYRILSMDCILQEDIDLIADAAVASGIKLVAVDPGPFTAALAKRLLGARESEGGLQGGARGRVLAVIGSVHPNAKVQMEELLRSRDVCNVFVRTGEFLEGDERREREIGRAAGLVLEGGAAVSSVVDEGIYPEKRVDLESYMKRRGCTLDEATAVINGAFAEIARRVLAADSAFRGLYTTGGDITVAVCSRLGAAGFDLVDEVLPLAAFGRLMGGEFDGVRIVTKGGSQGGPDAIASCISYIEERINQL